MCIFTTVRTVHTVTYRYIRNSSRVTTEASLPTARVLPVNADAGYVGIPQVG